MKKWVIISLAVIFLAAIFMRLLPLTQYAVWGSDTGEYFYLTNQLTKDAHVSTDYNGWGFGYPYFPGMFYLAGSISLLFGIDDLQAMSIFIPVTAAFSVLLVFVLIKMLFRNNAAGILGASITAVAMPHVFTTSHPMPGSVGDMFLILALLLLMASYRNKKFLSLLILTSLALILTHHLSSYFLFIMGLGGLFVKEMLQSKDSKDSKYIWMFLVFFLSVLILYWSYLASPFSERVVSDAFDIPVWAILSGGYVVLLLAFILIKIRRRIKWNYKLKFPGLKVQLVKYMALFSALILIMALVISTSIPGTNIDLKPLALIIFIPFFAIVAFGSVGPDYVKLFRNGTMIYGWILALFLSILIGVVTSNRVLLPYRHPQYLVFPLALLAGIGIVMVFDILGKKERKVKSLAYCVIFLLIALSAFSAYPPKDIMGGFSEGTSPEDMQAVVWAGESLEPGATVASDHRMSSMIFGFGGLNATWDAAENTLHGESLSEFQDELESIKIPSGEKSIDYVLLDDDIKEGAALLQWENAEPLSQGARDKFQKWPFVKLYEANGVEVYGIVE
jgi:4-amino-4-deoxy-L-arabinose transferase-like glycosyltransferase